MSISMNGAAASAFPIPIAASATRLSRRRSMPLIKGGRFVADPWRHLDDAAPVPEGEAVTVSLKRWSSERDALYRRKGDLGLRIPNDVPPMSLANLERFALVTLSFPRFTDGRAYSQARLLRTRLGFAS